MTDHNEHTDNPAANTAPWWHPRSLLTPTAAAVAAFAVAFLTLDGQNLLLIGIQSLLGQGFWSNNEPAGYYLVWGLAALVPLAVVLLLARVTLGALRSGWEVHLARAAVIVAAVAAAGAVLTAVGGILHEGILR
jgi:hypothetical protein